MKTFELQFQPDGLRINVEPGTTLTEAMKRIGLTVNLLCAGAGKCGKCVVEIRPDAPPPGDFDRLHLSEKEISQGFRLACQTKADRDMSVLVSDGMRILGGKILMSGAERTFDIDPTIVKKYVELPEPTLEDQAADLNRIKRGLGLPDGSCPDFDIDLIRDLPAILRDAEFNVTVVSHNDRVIAVEPGDTSSRQYGMAFDIGTTTVVGTILDLRDGSEVARASRLNEQVVYGEDTISRIGHAISDPIGREDLRSKIRSVINEIIHEAMDTASIGQHDIYEAVFAGNTTMSHLFLGLDVEGLSKIPFVPVINAPVNLRAVDAGIDIHPRGNLYILPNIAGFVGSDTVAVMLASDFLKAGPKQLAVDVGTNGELALRKGDELLVCSTAAGPALEGAALTCGMRAANGAIEHVSLSSGDVECEVIGNNIPIGLCGSGIIDILAELLKAGIIDEYGSILERDSLEGSVPEPLIARIITLDDQPAFRISGDEKSCADARCVVLTQKDVRQIQLAKGAIHAGIILILNELGMTADDLDELQLAGAFGNYIDRESAQRIGLLPQMDLDKIRFIGNAASTGSKMALLSREVRSDADRIRHETRHLELANLPDFMTALSDSMLFPVDSVTSAG